MWHILSHELKYYFKNIHELIYIYGFFALILLIVPMGMRQHLHALPEFAPTMVWIAILASLGLGATNLYQRDAESGVLEIYQQLPTSLSGVVMAKFFGFTMVTALPIAASMPLIIALFGLPVEFMLHYIVGAMAGATVIAILANMAAAITVGLERARAIVLLILLPLAVPVVIFGSEYLRHTGQLWQPQLLFLLALSVFLLPLMAMAGASCIRASN